MKVKWEPAWYELDQSVVVGDIDLFYLSKDKRYFSNGLMRNDDCEIRAEITDISHPELGEVKGIIAIGLCYTIYLSDGNEILVEAEEDPSRIVDCKYAIKEVREWSFDVQIRMIEETGLSSLNRAQALNTYQQNVYRQERIKRYKYLLDLTQVLWEG